jgi:FAD/FMN-containing dehydrogenase
MSLPRARVQALSGWGRYPVEECAVYRPERLDELEQIVAGAPETSLISHGEGRSYGDAALNEGQGVLLQKRLNRFLAFDEREGILSCEAGVTLSEILDHLLPRGFFLPITPGTQFISVGGAIAADVHGKNHHRDGTISNQLLDFRLLTGRGEILLCSRQENSELFWATLGGMGLTGAILDARLKLRAVETAYVNASTERCRNLDQLLERVGDSDADYDYAVAWIDCLARGKRLGRSLLLRANPAGIADLPECLRSTPHRISTASRFNVPFPLPSFLLNSFNMRLFNSAFYRAHRNASRIRDCQSYFYPLDSIGHWNRVYGNRGVLQYQLVLPSGPARRGLLEILERTTAMGRGSFLAVLKSTGPANSAPLSFPIEGISLALDFPYTGPALLELLKELDAIVLRHGGRVYLAKDCCLLAEDFRLMYPRVDEFLALKECHDPENRFSSSLARRLGLVGSS